MKTPRILFLLFALLTTLLAASDVPIATYTYNLQKGWNLIGVTLNPTEESAQELLGHGLYDFNGDTQVKAYCRSTEVVAGKAYWIYSESDESLAIKGTQSGDIQPGDPGTTGEYKIAIGDITSETSGEEVTVTAPAKEGYSFTEWTVEGVSIADRSQETLSFTMPTNNVMLEPNYTINSYTLTTDGTEEQVAYGTSVSKTATTKEGHTFTGWTVTGVTVDDASANPLTFTMPANAVTLKTNYSVNSYTLTTDGVDEQVDYGTTIEKTAPAKEGHAFTGWTITGVTVEDPTANPITFTMPANAVTLTANYSVNSYKLTTDDVEEQVDYGASVSKTAPAKEGYSFKSWTVEGVTVEDPTAATISFTMPANAVTLKTNYEEAQEGGTYLVVNLTDGSYSYTETAPDLTSDTCRTTELWLRRIPKGTFTMGSPTDEVGREPYAIKETQHQVTLSEDFYIGVFEMTQKQYELIYGSNPSYYAGDTRPVEQVSYNTIRGTSTGAAWPSSHDVDSDSFLGKLRSKTGLTFDLPTEAQWEYACRAGTTTALNTGKNLTSTGQDSAMDEAGRYSYNTSDGKGGYSSNHTKVGSYLPNNWGLYDMHGNVWEWCLDWHQSDLGSAAVTDPVGATSGSYRVLRGGCWYNNAQYCRSAYRSISNPSNGDFDSGFRVVLLP